MTLTENFMYSGPDHPGEDTLFPPDWNMFKNQKLLSMNASVDSATNLMIGNVCYLSAGTQANDMTATSAVWGKDSLKGLLFIVIPDGKSNYFAYNTDFLTNVPPNSAITASSYQYPANAKIKVAMLEVGDVFWGLISTDGNGATTFGYEYVPTANGLWAAPGDPDGVTIDEVSHYAVSLATTASQNWALLMYMGKCAHDKTA